jgi:signal transduction histidine kinase
VGRASRINRRHWSGTNALRLFGGFSLIIGWLGVYYAFHGHWLGILLPLLATGITFGAVHVGDIRSRAQNAALRDALAAAATRNRELERLRRVAATLLASSELAELLQEIADAAAELLQAESGAVTLVVEEGRFVRVAAATGPLAKATGSLIPVDSSLIGAAVSGGTPILTNDMAADPRSYRMPGLDVLLRTAAVVPLRSAGVVIGTVSVYNHREGRPFREHDLQLLETLGDQVVVGLDRASVLDEIRRSERTLAAKNVELQRATRLKSEFLANMSHELRTPLNAIIGFSDLMLTEGVGPVSPQQREFLEAILRNGRHLLELINGILDLSKIEAGRMGLSLVATDLREAITGAVADTESLRRAKNQNVWLELDDTPLKVVADGVRVRQVLFNFLSNASKFTGEGGSIILTALSTQAPLAPPADRAGDERKLVTRDVVWVSVADTGIGIAPEDMPKLFQEFSQVDSSASRQAQGTGLGLALSKKLVEMHGGTIGAESLPGRGSTFWFILPADGPVRRSQTSLPPGSAA